ISNDDMFNIIFTSLPRTYNTILSSLSMNMKLNNKVISPDILMSLILDEYDHLTVQNCGKSKSKDNDKEFTAESKE
ncbi:hypothetical protein BU17DRAFT_50316, partial [Hysterangium stoloniferum]